MSSSVVDLRAALEKRLLAMTGVLATQWENTIIKPDGATPYQMVFFLPAEPSNPEMNGTFFQENGFMQITLRYPTANGPGAGDAVAMAQAIRDWFPRGLSLTHGGVTVQINRTPAIGPGAVEGDRYSLPVKIRYFANNVS